MPHAVRFFLRCRLHANLLRARALWCIKAWHAKYGAYIKQLDLAYSFLSQRLHVRPEDLNHNPEPLPPQINFDEVEEQVGLKMPKTEPPPRPKYGLAKLQPPALKLPQQPPQPSPTGVAADGNCGPAAGN